MAPGDSRAPGNYVIDYDAIMSWITNTDASLGNTTVGSKVLPDLLRCGRMTYYDAKPTSINAYARADSASKCYQYTPSTWSNWESLAKTDKDMLNRRFWMEYIDYVLMVRQTSAGVYVATNKDTVYGGPNTYTVPTNSSSYQLMHGDDFAWGTVSVGAKNSSNNYSWTTSTDTASPSPWASENPLRPKLHFWFGPLSVADFVTNIRWFANWPGNTYQAPMFECMYGYSAALEMIKNNHPNDYVTMAFFSNPVAANTTGLTTNSSAATLQTLATTYNVDPGAVPGRHNRALAPLGNYYNRLLGSLYYPVASMDFSGISTSNAGTTTNWQSVAAYNTNDTNEAPYGRGHTCYDQGIMLIHNQFSSNSSLVNYSTSNGLTNALPGEAGGNGRVGAQKLMIFETDGNATTYVDLSGSTLYQNGGSSNSYYKIRPGGSGNPGNEVFPNITVYTGSNTAAYSGTTPTAPTTLVNVNTLTNRLVSDFSTTRKPALVHCLVFETPTVTVNYQWVLQMMYLGNTASWSQVQNLTFPSDHLINSNGANYSSVISQLKTAVQNILQDGIQVSLIQ
jgi:hypothetical protein